MASAGVDETKTSFHADVSALALSPSSPKDREEGISVPPSSSLSVKKPPSAQVPRLSPPSSSFLASANNLIEEQTSVYEATTQKNVALPGRPTERKGAPPSARVNCQVLPRGGGRKNNSATATEEKVNFAVEGARRDQTFAFPTIRPRKSTVSSSSASSFTSAAATMVAVTTAAHRPVLYKSHSVAYGEDSTVSSSPLPPSPPPPLPTQAMANESEQILLPQSSEFQGEVIPPPMHVLPLSASSSSPSLSSLASHPPPPPHPRGLSRVLAENADLPHQGSLGFTPPESFRYPLQRSESLQSDSAHPPHGLLPSGAGTIPASPGRQSGRPHRTRKWRSSSVRRSSSRNQPLFRSSSRSSDTAALPDPYRTRCQSEGRDFPGPVPFTPTPARDQEDLIRNDDDERANLLQNLPASQPLPQQAFRPNATPTVLNTLFTKPTNLEHLEQKDVTLSETAWGERIESPPTAQKTTQFEKTPGKSDHVVDMESVEGSLPRQPPSHSLSRPFHRQVSRRRSYREAAGDPTTSDALDGGAADDEKSDDGDDDDLAEDGEGGVRVEDVPEEEEDEVVEEEEDSPSLTPPGSPRPAKSRRVDMSSFDPYQIFEVQHLPCIILTVKVLQGRNITNGWAQDLVDTPDPYIKLRIKTAPEGRQRTRTVANNANPVWNEEFTFYLGFSENNVLELTLMEENPLMDQETGTIYFNVHDRIREFDIWQTEIFNFNGVSEVDVAFHMTWDQNPTLRYSLCLSDQEKEFMRKRKQKVWQALNAILGEKGPKTVEETPTIAVIGSGGGFRAMTGYSGVFKALADSGILDCATYACGLSGSSWYLSTLYSHERWPGMNPGELQQELMGNIDKSLVRLLGPQSLYRYVRSVVSKRREGQPVSFTDFFGHMVGETLLKGRLNSRLTDQREKIENACVPMPLYTCVHVKKDVPARSFQEWVEFSPYEIGMPKYGTFMDSKYFGSKFYMGKLVKSYQEPPLHFLQGIWGSAFCILFKRLLEDNRNLDPAEMLRREMELRNDLSHQLQEEDDVNESSDISDDDDDDDEEDETDETDEEPTHAATTSRRRRSSSTSLLVPPSSKKTSSPEGDWSSERDSSEGESSGSDVQPPASFLAPRRQDSSEGFDEVDDPASPGARMEASSPRPIFRTTSPGGGGGGGGLVMSGSPDGPKKGVRFSRQVEQLEKRKAQQHQQHQDGGGGGGGRKSERKPLLRRTSTVRRGRSRSYWSSILRGVFESQSCELLSTRAGRAAVIHNFMRGLNLQQTYPLSPFTPLSQRVRQGDEFDGIFDLHPTHIKHIYMVDAGLTFNSPYPLVLRPQRGVDVILSFDFSARDSDGTPPFKELLLAEKWAKINRLPFPPIDPGVVDREGLKELYVFQDPEDPHCPVVLHFPLVNIHFRDFKTPGVPRETKEEKDFADFDIFDDPTAPFSTFNFTYTAQNFQRLSKLTEFNTLHSLDRVKDVLAQVVSRKRQASPRAPIHTRDFKLLRMKSVQERRELKKFLKKMESRGGGSVRTPTPTGGSNPPTPFFTPGGPRNSPLQERNPFVFDLKNKSSSSSDSSQEGRNPFFSTSRQSSQSKSRTDSGRRSSKSPRRGSNRSPRSPRKRLPETDFRRELSRGSSQEFVSTSSVPPPPSPSPSTDSYDDVFHRSPSTPTTTATTASPFLRPSSFHEPASAKIGNLRQNSSASLRQSPGLARAVTEDEDEEFHDAAEAFTRDGEAVTDSQRAKMYYEGAKERRKMLRRQSTISTLNSITESISLDSENPPSRLSTATSEASSSGPISMDIADLEQFEGIADDGEDSRSRNDVGNKGDDDTVDDVDEHWYDGDESPQHRGSVISLDGSGGS